MSFDPEPEPERAGAGARSGCRRRRRTPPASGWIAPATSVALAELVDVRVEVDRKRGVAREAVLVAGRDDARLDPRPGAARRDDDAEVRDRPVTRDAEDLLGAREPGRDEATVGHLRIAVDVRRAPGRPRVSPAYAPGAETAAALAPELRDGDPAPERDASDDAVAAEDDDAREISPSAVPARDRASSVPGTTTSGGDGRGRAAGAASDSTVAVHAPDAAARVGERHARVLGRAAARRARTRPRSGVGRTSGSSAAATSTRPGAGARRGEADAADRDGRAVT